MPQLLHLYPELELFVIYAIMALVLIFRPKVCSLNPSEEDMTRLFDKTFWGLTVVWLRYSPLISCSKNGCRSAEPAMVSRGCAGDRVLVLWRTGLVSFGHALFFRFRAYTVAMLQIIGVNDIILLLIGGCATAGLLALVLGFLLRQYRAIFRSAEHGVLNDSLWRPRQGGGTRSTDGMRH